MPTEVGYERHTKCARNDLANTDVKQVGQKGFGDGPCNGNEEE